MYEVCLRGKMPQASDLLTKDDNVKLKRCIFAQGKKHIDKFLCHIIIPLHGICVLLYFYYYFYLGFLGLPPITTHNVMDDQLDPVMNAFRR